MFGFISLIFGACSGKTIARRRLPPHVVFQEKARATGSPAPPLAPDSLGCSAWSFKRRVAITAFAAVASPLVGSTPGQNLGRAVVRLKLVILCASQRPRFVALQGERCDPCGTCEDRSVSVPKRVKKARRVMVGSDPPLSREARVWTRKLLPRIQARLAEASRVPVGVLIWGPDISSSSPLASVRAALRRDLRHNGHAAFFSEELCDARTGQSIRLQQLVQALEFDIVVSLPCTPGSIAELHDFATDSRVNAKTLVFLNGAYVGGYAYQSCHRPAYWSQAMIGI